MEKQINYPHLASIITQTAFLNCYIRDVKQGGILFFKTPKQDAALAYYFNKKKHEKWIKITLDTLDKDIYCALRYYSLTGRHQYHFPCIIKDRKSNAIQELSLLKLSAIILEDYINQKHSTQKKGDLFLQSIENSAKNTALFLQYRVENTKDIAAIFDREISFIDAEQGLLTGHAMHPVPKSRSRMTETELSHYAPETKARFAIHYLLAAPEVVLENNAQKQAISSILEQELEQKGYLSTSVQKIIDTHKGWKLVPIHPWEEKYLSEQDTDFQNLIKEKKILSLGALGPLYTPTSSVRTLYNEDSLFMIKLSLHVKITNSERCNLYHELIRGYQVSGLFATKFGEKFRENNPHFKVITDPAYITLQHNGKVIKGCNTSFRENTKSIFLDKKIAMLGELCQDAILGHTNRLYKTITHIAKLESKSLSEVCKKWFDLYLAFYLEGILSGYIDFGMFFEAHGQNTMIELDNIGYPCNVYFRDSQGIIFREEKHHLAHKYIQDIGVTSKSILPDAILTPIYVNYIMISNIIGLINALGSNGLAKEHELLEMVTHRLKKWENKDDSGIIAFILKQSTWKVKSNLLTRLSASDEAMNPVDGVIHVAYKNPLLYRYYEPKLLQPTTTQCSFTYWEKQQNIRVTIRPFHIDTDLEMVHQWFHQKKALRFWKMNRSLQELEAFYIGILTSDATHAYIGEVNGVACFTFEPYWAVQDVVGGCYSVKPTDYGFHFLIDTQAQQKVPTVTCLQAITDYMFSFTNIKTCILEPDIQAKAMAIVLERAGYTLEKQIEQPHKKSNLFTYTKQDYLKQKASLLDNVITI